MDQNLTGDERTLAAVVLDVAGAVDARNDGYWAEDHTPPDSDDDVLTSTLYTRPGDPEPTAGFTLWTPGGDGYRLTLQKLPS
jgi:hypothetical protein